MTSQMLIDAGCTNVKYYALINNDGYTFVKNGVRYDVRHWLNCYGADVDYWSIHNLDEPRYIPSVNTAAEMLDIIKAL